MQKMAFRIALGAAAASLVSLAGCATSLSSLFGPIDLSRVQDPALRAPVGELALEPALDVYGVRMDLWRGITTVQSSSGKGTSSAQAEYSAIGAYLGSGIIVDSNFNVGVDLVKYFGLGEESFAFDQYVTWGKVGKLKSFIHIERNGGESLRSENVGLMTIKLRTRAEGSRFVTEGPAFKQVVERSADGKALTVEQRRNLFTFKGKVSFSRPDTLDLDFLVGNRVLAFVSESPARISFRDQLIVERQPDRIRITANRFGGTAKGVYDLIPSTEGFFLLDEKGGVAMEVRKVGKDLKIYINGTLAGEYRSVG